jgi:uncharacterized protein
LKMLVVHEGELMVQEKAIFTVEKFLVSRRLMYWQVYLHKAVVSAEKMLVKVFERAGELLSSGIDLKAATTNLDFFLKEEQPADGFVHHIEKFAQLDDTDVMCTLKNWCGHPDNILSKLSQGLVDRKLLKINFQAEPFDEEKVADLRRSVAERMGVSPEEASYLVFTGEAVSTTYNPYDEHIKILYKDGTVSDISRVDNALIHHQLSSPLKKYYLCSLRYTPLTEAL